MKKYDVENLIDDLVTMFKNNFSSAVSAMNTEKGDSLLVVPDTNAWFFQNLNSKSFNYEPFVLYSIDPILESANKAAVSTNIRVSFEIALVDNGSEDTKIYFRKLLRYTRILTDIFCQYSGSIDSSASMTVATLTPLSMEINGKVIQTAGITINASIFS